MPTDQRREFDRLVGHLRQANGHVGSLILFLTQEVRLLEVRYGWLLTLRMQALEFSLLAGEVAMTAQEPVTAHQWKQLKNQPGAADRYHVYSDEQSGSVATMRAFRGHLRDALGGAAREAAEPGAGTRVPQVGGVGPVDPAALAQRLGAAIREGLETLWPELLALGAVVDEVAAEFHGEDVLKPLFRQALEEAETTMNWLHERLQEDGEPDPLRGRERRPRRHGPGIRGLLRWTSTST